MTETLGAGSLIYERYRVLDLIGQGGMGAVYLTQDQRLTGRRCALKEILLPPGMSPKAEAQARAQFHREASTLARLDHPNLPKVSDYFSIAERDYLVMDYVPGRTLLQVVRQARQKGRFLDERQVLSWIDQLCDALRYLHHQDPPIIHRDIKPENAKITPQGQIKLVDFGLVKPVDPEDMNTLTGLRGMGSLPYTPIEQYSDVQDHTDVRSDLYALGATLYHLLTGAKPPSAQSVFVRPETLVPPRQINSAISPAAERAILSAMATHPSQRPPTVEAWLQQLYNQTANPSTPPTPHQSELKGRINALRSLSLSKGHALWIVLGTLLTLVVLYLTWVP